jgi:hypothetical protein
MPGIAPRRIFKLVGAAIVGTTVVIGCVVGLSLLAWGEVPHPDAMPIVGSLGVILATVLVVRRERSRRPPPDAGHGHAGQKETERSQ